VLRSERFVVGGRPEFAPWQTWAVRLLADPAVTRAKAEGRLAAELVLEVMMKPLEGSSLSAALLNGGHDDLAVVLASAVLNMGESNVQSLPDLMSSKVHASTTPTRQAFDSGMPVVVQRSLSSETSTLSSSDQSIEEKLTEMVREIKELKEQLDRQANHNPPAQAKYGGDHSMEVDAGNGLKQLYLQRIPEEMYKYRLEQVEIDLGEIKAQMSILTTAQGCTSEDVESRLAFLEHQLAVLRPRRQRRGMFDSRLTRLEL
jgi:hypothetical protein